MTKLSMSLAKSDRSSWTCWVESWGLIAKFGSSLHRSNSAKTNKSLIDNRRAVLSKPGALFFMGFDQRAGHIRKNVFPFLADQ